jgi:CubicO group peptidase (beta-lactamase class C family)
MRRREILRLVAACATSLAAACEASGAPAIHVPEGAPTDVPDGSEQLAPQVAEDTPTPTRPTPPTQTPTLEPSPTQTATFTPTVVATRIPTVQPTATPPPGLAIALEAAMQRAVQDNVLPGGVVLIRHRGVQVMLSAYGFAGKYEAPNSPVPNPPPARTDTLYDLASITKMFTATAAMQLVDSGRLSLDKPLANEVPPLGAGGKTELTLRHVLTHTSGLPALLELWRSDHTLADRVQRVLDTPLRDPPGSVLRYSDVGFMLLGYALEQLVGKSLDQIARDQITQPLRLAETMYRPDPGLKPRIAPTEYETDPARGMVWGEVDDANAWSLGGAAGHAGLFATAADVGRFAQLFLNSGELDGVRLLREETVAEMTRNQVGKLGWRGLGWELNTSFYMGRLASPQTYGHTGFTGTSLVIDPRRQLIVVLLTNRVHPVIDGPSVHPTRQAVANAALAAADAA